MSVTTLVDNVFDLLLVDQGPAKRPPLAPMTHARMPARFLEGGYTGGALRAEHGFSSLVTIEKAGRATRILFDTGITPDGLVQNMSRLGLSAHDIDIIVLSHGHWDHTTGMDGLVEELGRPNVPVLIHPDFWSRRRVAIPGREPVELPSTSRGALEGAGFEIVEQRQPSFLLDGSLLVTGEVDRTTEFEQGLPSHQAHRHGSWQARPADTRRPGAGGERPRPRPRRVDRLRPFGDRQHAALRAEGDRRDPPPRRDRRLSPRRPRVREAHLPHLDALAALEPDYLVPSHCTGWRATQAIAASLPDAFIQNSVGTRFEFAAAQIRS